MLIYYGIITYANKILFMLIFETILGVLWTQFKRKSLGTRLDTIAFYYHNGKG